MNASVFAANLRAAMALATPPRVPSHLATKMLGLPEKYADWTPEQEAEAQILTGRIAAWGWPRSSEEALRPTPAEIEAIATALGCPVERLTVSREELEATVEVLELNLGFRQLEIADLTSEVERISAERDHYREEAAALREIIEMPTMAQYALGAGTQNEKRHSYGCPHCRKVNPIGQMCGCVGRRLEALEAENADLKAKWEAFHTGTEIIVPDWVQGQISEEAKRRRDRYGA